MTRTNQTDTAGYGMIGRLAFVLADDLGGASDLPFHVELSDPILVNHQLIAQGVSVNNDTMTILQEPLSLADALGALQLEIRPNPANELVELRIPDHRMVAWRIVDLQGRLIQQGRELDQERMRIDTRNVSEGVYLVQVESQDGRIVTKKLTIMR